MKKKLGYFILSIISLFIVSPVNAEECDYGIKADLNKYAFNVKADYEFKDSGDGTTTIDIVIYNIVDDIYINYKSGIDDKASMGTNISSIDAANGTYRFNVPIPKKTYKYTFVVRTTIEGCAGDLRKFTLDVPIKNEYHDTFNCKKEGMEDYYYCKEWITEEFPLTKREILQKIEDKWKSIQTTTTYCPSCLLEEKMNNKDNKMSKLKSVIILGLSIGIVIDLIIIGFMIRNIKEGEIYE